MENQIESDTGASAEYSSGKGLGMQSAADRRRKAVYDYYAAVDKGDRGAVRASISADLQFRFANAAPQSGRDSVRLVGEKLRSIATGLVHDIETVHVDGSASYATVELTMTYEMPGEDLQVPACVILGFNDNDLISEYRIYVDVSALGVDTRAW